MSKVDAMRALREAKQREAKQREAQHVRGGALPDAPGSGRAATSGAATTRTPAPRTATTRTAAPRTTPSRPSAPRTSAAGPSTGDVDEGPGTTPTEQACGHRNMGGKSCSRPAGHSEKNHRYR